MAEAMRATVAALLHGIDRYNPENLATLERYVDLQCKENTYDLEANLAVLKLYQFNPTYYQTSVTAQILMKALTNLPHSDFTLCKCLLDQVHQEEEMITRVTFLADLLETCQFKSFWKEIALTPEVIEGVSGFEDSVRKFICHVVSITYQRIDKQTLLELLGDIEDHQLKQWMNKYGWRDDAEGFVFLANQEENVKTKNIVEKIDFDSVAGIMAAAIQR
ncbi:eukaryotic translation initiation factor 3 subunit K-like [Branchiostoma lanceolatum]|uniref:Eukaryotic translation initiation factor 3 subunit K n=1 Tax=Branchiostoma lanceolatum TaxID=7740 RepID=A0A8K0EPQ7_BRALA|nr:EIF3K [Branchiostoma lanceolatum]